MTQGDLSPARNIVFINYLKYLARILLPGSGMVEWSSAALSSRFLEPLLHPWSLAASGLLGGGGSAGMDALGQGVRVVWRLFGLLLSL
jgi:hypothetical protein